MPPNQMLTLMDAATLPKARKKELMPTIVCSSFWLVCKKFFFFICVYLTSNFNKQNVEPDWGIESQMSAFQICPKPRPGHLSVTDTKSVLRSFNSKVEKTNNT